MNRNSTDLPTGTMVRNGYQLIVALVIALAVISVGSVACVSNRGTITGPTNAPVAGTTTANVIAVWSVIHTAAHNLDHKRRLKTRMKDEGVRMK